MSRIASSNPGRRDGGYARIFDDADIGALISRVHGISIRAGTKLEHIIQQEAMLHDKAIDNLDTFLDNGVDGVFIASKQTLKGPVPRCRTRLHDTADVELHRTHGAGLDIDAQATAQALLARRAVHWGNDMGGPSDTYLASRHSRWHCVAGVVAARAGPRRWHGLGFRSQGQSFEWWLHALHSWRSSPFTSIF